MQNDLLVHDAPDDAAQPGTAIMAGETRSLAPAPGTRRAGGSITELLYMAVEKGTPVAELKELVALHEQMGKREALQEFAAAMAAFQAECPPIKKSSTAKVATRSGTEYSFTYAELDEIARTINPIAAKHGLSYTWDAKVEGNQLTCVCTVRHTAGHSNSASLSLPVENPSAMSPQQKVGAALTFAQRKTVCSVFGLVTSDDEPQVAAADKTPINDDQLTVIEDLVTESGANLPRFLKYFDIETLATLPATEYDRAVKVLRETQEKREARR
jgi:ERF superfamily